VPFCEHVIASKQIARLPETTVAESRHRPPAELGHLGGAVEVARAAEPLQDPVAVERRPADAVQVGLGLGLGLELNC